MGVPKMKRRRSLLTTMVIAAMLLGMFAVPASAKNSYVGTLVAGNATVGKWFGDGPGEDCTKDTADTATPGGKGLYLVGTPLDKARERHGVWQISAPITYWTDKGEMGMGMLHACGWLDAIMVPDANPDTNGRFDGIGAACGASKGFGGRGWVEDATGMKLVKLSDLGWKNAVGGLLPVNGNFTEYDPDGSKNGKTGAVKAEIQATGGNLSTDCLGLTNVDANGKANGAQNFFVNGTFELINGVFGEKTPNDPNGDGVEEFPKDNSGPGRHKKECKETAPEEAKQKPAGMQYGPEWCPPSEGDKA